MANDKITQFTIEIKQFLAEHQIEKYAITTDYEDDNNPKMIIEFGIKDFMVR